MDYNNINLVAFVKLMIGCPYWMGTYGQIASEKLYLEKKRQYKDQYEKWSKASFEVQYGKKVVDCSGLIKSFFMTPTPLVTPNAPAVYNGKYDYSANGMIDKCTEKGPIATIPEIVGLIVWKNNHVGVYIGNGEVIEAKGHKYGVVKSDLKATAWLQWGKLPWLDYVSKPDGNSQSDLPVLRKGSKGTEVRSWQVLLNEYGFRDQNGNKLEVDESFGGKTEYATMSAQKYYGLVPDGIVGEKTWIRVITGK